MARIVYTDMSGQERSVPFSAEAPVVSIGRATDCTIRSNRKSVSRRHAEFRFANGQFEVIDLNSSNGTYLIINEERKPVLGREYLAHNDEVWCGDFILTFFEEDSATADQYGEDAVFGSPNPHHSTQPPAFGGAPQSSFGGSNGQFGQGSFEQQNSQSQAPWSPATPPPHQPQPSQNQPPPQSGPRFATNQQFGQPAGFGNEPQFNQQQPGSEPRFNQQQQQPGFGNDSQFGQPSFGNESQFGQQVGFGDEPSFANDPPQFGEPSTPHGEGSTQNQSYDPPLDTSTQNQADLAAFMQQSEEYRRLEQERDSYAELAERQKADAEDLQARLKEALGELEGMRADEDAKDGATSVALPPEALGKLRDELIVAKTSVEELTVEIDRAKKDAGLARADIAAAKADTAAARAEVAASQAKHEAAQSDLATAQKELSQLRGDTTAADLQREVESLREDTATLEQELAAARELAAAPDPIAEGRIAALEEQVAGKDRDVLALESEVDRLSAESQANEQRASEVSKVEGQRTKEEAEALRRELERHKRLVEEFEKRNRELQMELEEVHEGVSTVQSKIDEGNQKREEIEGELETLAADLEGARIERDQALTTIEEMKAAGDIGDLRNEIEGLKHRLKMEKERAGEGDARLTDEIDRLNAQVGDLEAENTGLREAVEASSVAGGASAQDISLLREKVSALDRIVDAIVRTNLDPLSTVDRIRLQSAIRDTDPKATLAILLDLTSSD